MQVISSQCSSSARSTSRSRKKGLSLTSHSKLSSQQKQFCTEDTLESIVFAQRQTQTSIRFENSQDKIPWLKENTKQFSQAVTVPKTLSDMPKITFRYTNETAKCPQSSSIFPGQFDALTNCIASRGRPMNSQEMRRVVISSSLQTKNLSQSKVNTQTFINEANPTKQLIDSRRIDREIVEEKVIAYLLPVKQKTVEMNASLIQKSPQRQSIYILNDTFSSHIEIKNESKPDLNEQKSSPYHLLASSAQKNQSKQLQLSMKSPGSLQVISLEKIPQVQEFNLNQNDQEQEQSFEENKQISKDEDYAQVSALDQQTDLIDKIQIRVSEPVSLASQISKQEIESSKVKVLENKQFNVIQDLDQVDNLKSKSKSPLPSKQRKEETIFAQIENRVPQSQQVCSMSGRRNIKRIKEIEKRLQEIINICSNNL